MTEETRKQIKEAELDPDSNDVILNAGTLEQIIDDALKAERERLVYVAIDVGCHECGVDSEVIGSYNTEEEAESACKKKTDEHNNWRDGGQTIPQVFTVNLINPPSKE